MSRIPITASIPAAVVAAIPWSWAAGMKCTAISPTVVAPQTKKLSASAQNVAVRAASRRTAIALDASAPPRAGLDLGAAVGRDAEVGGAVAHQQPGDRQGDQRRAARHDHHPLPARQLDVRHQRQEDQLTGRVRRRQQPDHQPAPRVEPAGGDHRGQHRCDRAGRGARHEPPQQVEVPRLRDERRQAGRQRRSAPARRSPPAAARSAPRARRERPADPEDDQVDRDRPRRSSPGSSRTHPAAGPSGCRARHGRPPRPAAR